MSFKLPVQIPSALDIVNYYKIGSEDPADAPIDKTYLGTPVYSNLIFLTDNTNIESDLRIDTVLMSVDQSKEIVKTAIQGRNGTVKEYISLGDYVVNIKGAIVSPFPEKYPKDDIDLLLRYLSLDKQVGVSSFFLELFNISEIVIERYSVSEKIGSRNEVPFEITAVSDTPLEFQLNPNVSV